MGGSCVELAERGVIAEPSCFRIAVGCPNKADLGSSSAGETEEVFDEFEAALIVQGEGSTPNGKNLSSHAQLNHGHALAVYSEPMEDRIHLLATTVDRLFEESGHVSYGETVTQREHALQAAMLAEAEGASHSLILASLLHDVGHMLHPDAALALAQSQDDTHEEIGARWLGQYFGPAVCDPVALHVHAKRYLCWAEPDYYDTLSEVSKMSLALQGGVMTDDEAQHFLRLPFARDAISLRRWDERAKECHAATPDLAYFLQSLRHCLQGT